MTADDEERGDNLDYTAWEAPPPPAGLADAVVAKLRRPVGAPDVAPARPQRLRWIAAGAIAASAAAGIAIVVWPESERAALTAATSGHVTAAKPSHVALGASAVPTRDRW
jgi:hypothetical protein